MKRLMILSLMVLGLISCSNGSDDGIQWQEYTARSLAEAQQKGQNIILGFHKAGCGTCFSQDEILESRGISDNQKIAFLKVEYTSGANTPVYQKYGIGKKWAALVLLNPKGEEISRVSPFDTKVKSIAALAEKAKKVAIN